MDSFKAVRQGKTKFYNKDLKSIHIHTSKRDGKLYLYSTKLEFISNLFPIKGKSNKWSIPNYKGDSYIVTEHEDYLEVVKFS